MTTKELIAYYVNGHQFCLRTRMAANSFRNWCSWGYIPLASQYHIELLTQGELKANSEHARPHATG